MELPKSGPLSGGSIEICLSSAMKQSTVSVGVDASNLESKTDIEQLVKMETSSKEVYTDEVSKTVERASASSADASDALGPEPHLQVSTETKDRNPCSETSPPGDSRTVVEPEGKSGFEDGGTGNDYEGAAFAKNKDGTNSSTPVMQESSAKENYPEKGKDSGRYLLGVEHVRRGGEVAQTVAENLADRQSNDFGSADRKLPARASEVTRKKSDIELEYDMGDPLEVARQVAIEVEREVVDGREGSCSSSDGAPESYSKRTDNTANAPETRTSVQEDLSKDTSSEEELSSETSGDEAASCAENDADEAVNSAQEIENSQVTEVNRELPADAEKSFCNFDLNQEVSAEMDGLENQLSPTAASASRAAAATEMTVGPFAFDGKLGWKGSSATRVFRATSPLQVPEVDKTHSVGGSNSSSKQRDDCLDIDLNMDDSLDEKTADLLTERQNPEPSSLPSGESAVEVSQKRSERLELDLNCTTDDGDGTSDWQTEGQSLHLRNGYHNRSPSSSSSSKQPSFRNFDLNDHPSFASELPAHPFFVKVPQDYNAPVPEKSNDSMISIMGMRLEMNKSETIPNSIPFLNGRNPEPPLDANVMRAGGLFSIGPAVPYPHPPVYGYTGIAPAAAAGAMSSAMYGPNGPFPYMLDLRGAPVMPQVMGSPPALQPAFSQQHFMMSMAGMPGSHGVGPSGVNLDLNTGLVLDGGNRDNSGGLRQFLSTGQGRLMDNNLTSNSQSSAAFFGGMKRREPDSGWEPESHPFKHHQPTWK